jgi:exodeoxyribonuclease-3
MKILSWNVNGLRACAKKGFRSWLDASDAEIVGVQEVRSPVEELPPEVASPTGWHTHFVAAQKAGYSGVGLYSRRPADEIITSIGVKEFDAEARVQLARFGQLVVANVYFPNGKGTDRDNSRVPFKLKFYKRLFKLLEEQEEAGRRVLVMGDFNTAHKEIDLARPKANVDESGFLPEERAELDRWMKKGWHDTFRLFHPEPDQYSWWTVRGGAREKNVGWRIDMVVASNNAREFVRDGFIHQHVLGSDHCPVGVTVDPAIAGESTSKAA